MRRRLVRRPRCVGFGLPQAIVQIGELAGERIDLMPLRGDGLVEGFDGDVLKRQSGFKRIDAIAEAERNGFTN